jgi:outer membrane protein OmpA-like peptidoglycan-associated protein
MKIKTAKLAAVGVVVVAAAGCAGTDANGPPLRLDPFQPAAVVILASPGAVSAGVIPGMIAPSARPGERVEVVDPANESVRVLTSTTAPVQAPIAGPVPPHRLGGDPTAFQIRAHRRQYTKYELAVAQDRRRLWRLMQVRMGSWAAGIGTTIRAGIGRSQWSVAGLRAGLVEAASYFASLQEAGVNLGPRKLVLVLWNNDLPDPAAGLPVGSLSGDTMIIAGFPGNETEQAEWQADLLQAGASRAVVLVPAASDELASAVRMALRGRSWPAVTTIYFPLNRATLRPAARAALLRLATELTSVYPNATATVLGFADPIGTPGRNAVLSADRALAAKEFLIRHGVASSRLYAAGYGADLPASPSDQDGVQPLDRRVVIVIDPLT